MHVHIYNLVIVKSLCDIDLQPNLTVFGVSKSVYSPLFPGLITMIMVDYLFTHTDARAQR